jgi:hypothetical protein
MSIAGLPFLSALRIGDGGWGQPKASMAGRKGSLLFCEQKRSKKNFCNLARAGETFGGLANQKFFAAFFQERSAFLAPRA